jgi:hypothetical protein
LSSSRSARLEQRARATARRPTPSRLAAPQRRGYRVVAISLYSDEATWLDAATSLLQAGGFPKANRSLVVREAVLQLKAQLEDRQVTTREQLTDFFRTQYLRRRRTS